MNLHILQNEVLATISSFVIILIVPGLALAAEDYNKIIDECEDIFSELEELGKAKFEQRYLHFKNLRNCYVLYNEPIWYSNSPDRTQKLIEMLGKPKHDIPIRDRFVQSDAIPQWIKDDATRWHQGKEKDSIFSYGIRYLINSKMIQTPISIFDPQNCVSNAICISKNDYIKYSIKSTQIDDVITQTHTFDDGDNTITINTSEISKDGKKINTLRIQDDGLIRDDQRYYQFVHKIPIELGTTIKSAFDIKVTDEILFPFKDTKRDVFLTWDDTRQYYEIIDNIQA